MARKAYSPEQGYQYQLFYRYGTREWEHLDYATDTGDKNYLMGEYSLAYRGAGGEIGCQLLPKKYWDMEKVLAHRKEIMDARIKNLNNDNRN
jgi:hypothetical protein